MESLTAKGALYAEIKSKLSSNVYKKNKAVRTYNLRKLNSESKRIKGILDNPSTKQKKAYEKKLADLETLKKLIEELPEEEGEVVLPEPTPKSRFVKPSKQEVNPPTVILGHGHDICFSNGTLEELIVPPNCVYISFTLCGLVNFLSDESIKKFFDPKNKKYLDDPIKYEEDLQRIFKAIHIHKPGSTYINTGYHLNNYHQKYNQYGMSGVIPLDGNSKIIPRLTNERFTEATQEHITDLFTYSIYPKKEDVGEEYNNIKKGATKDTILNKLDSKIPYITQEELFKLRPGIYYNPLCRVVHKRCQQHIGKRRANSLVNAKRVINEVDIEGYTDYIEKIAHICDFGNSCEEIEELYKELPRLTHFGLLAVEHAIKKITEKRFTKDNSRVLKLLKYIEELKIKDTADIDLINKAISNILKTVTPAHYINVVVTIINSYRGEKRAELIRLTNIEIDRKILLYKQLREEIKQLDGLRGGKRRTTRKV